MNVPTFEAISTEAANLHGAFLQAGLGSHASAIADNFGKFYAGEKSAGTFWAEIQGGFHFLKRRTQREEDLKTQEELNAN